MMMMTDEYNSYHQNEENSQAYLETLSDMDTLDESWQEAFLDDVTEDSELVELVLQILSTRDHSTLKLAEKREASSDQDSDTRVVRDDDENRRD